jgi:hypothetical protein
MLFPSIIKYFIQINKILYTNIFYGGHVDVDLVVLFIFLFTIMDKLKGLLE